MEVATKIAIKSVIIKHGLVPHGRRRENVKTVEAEYNEDQRIPPVPTFSVVDNTLLSQHHLFFPGPLIKTGTKNRAMNGCLPIDCLFSEGNMFDDYNYRIEIGWKLLKPDYQVPPGPGYPLLPNSRKNRRKADKIYQKMLIMIVEIHKVCFNIHFMLIQMEINEWGLTVQQFQHLFHEVRDGSWNSKKLLDDTIEITEMFRKYILILDIYAKVFINEFFNHWKLLVHVLCHRKREELSQEVKTFQHNLIAIKNKYDHLKKHGYNHNRQLIGDDENEHFHGEKKQTFFEGSNHGHGLSSRGMMVLKEAFSDEFIRKHFLQEVTVKRFYDCKSAFETDEEDNDTRNSMLIHQQDLLKSQEPQPKCLKKKAKLRKTEDEIDEETFGDNQGISDVGEQTHEIKKDNPDADTELDVDKSEEEYFTGIDE